MPSSHRTSLKHRAVSINLLLPQTVVMNAVDALLWSCRTRGNANISRLLRDHGSSVNGKYKTTSPLIEAASRGHLENVAVLLEFGVDANRITTEEETPLTFAIVHGTAAVMRLLIPAGANVNFIDSRGCTPLGYAIFEKDLETVRVLLDAKADPRRS
jgi:ankyrin repeat protein